MMFQEDLGDIFFNVDEQFYVGSNPPGLALPGMESRPALRGSTEPEQKRHEKDFHEIRSSSLRNIELPSG
jgi:hypothetical protein